MKKNVDLLTLEMDYITKLNPEYNILTSSLSTIGYKHTEETINKIKTNYSEEKREN